MTAGSIIVPTIIPLRAPVPGKPKHLIDSNTRIEIKSDSSNTDIYYTIDGSKPEPFAALGTDKSTFKYKGPFTLPEGKQIVKALATSKDGVRQSNVNTKLFEVEYIVPDIHMVANVDDDKAFQKELIKEKGKVTPSSQSLRRAWNEKMENLEATMTDMKVTGSTRRPAPSSARFTSSRFEDLPIEQDPGPQVTVPDSRRQLLRLQKETDFLRCIYCYADRPSDPYARFCHKCGNAVPPIPSYRLTVPQPGEMGQCIHCKSQVPQNTSSCVICEASIPEQNHPQMALRLAQSKVCRYCGTGNPPTLSTCVLCEAALPAVSRPVHEGRESAPALPPTGAPQRRCSNCSRINNADARFCDWCGTKPASAVTLLGCSRCGASNGLFAAYCAVCGVRISAPQNTSGTVSSSDSKPHWTAVSPSPSGIVEKKLQEVITTPKPVPTSTAATQTVGLFYPSERQLKKQRDEEIDKFQLEKQMRDRKPLLTSVSPGKGYWRKQMEHITIHLKAEAQNNPEFRALIGEPRMGKLTSVAVHDDGLELTLTSSFSLREISEPFRSAAIPGSKVLSDLTRRPRIIDSDESEESDDVESIERSDEEETAKTPEHEKKKKSKSKRKSKKVPSLSLEDRKLLKEIGKTGEGRAQEVQELITEGASPVVVSNQGTPAVVMATMNNHIECVGVLLQAGADVNARAENGNTALHEAILLGFNGKDLLDLLISHGASLTLKNNKQQTAHDIAVRSGNDLAIKVLMSSMAQSQLDKMAKPRSGKAGKLALF